VRENQKIYFSETAAYHCNSFLHRSKLAASEEGACQRFGRKNIRLVGNKTVP